LSTNSKPFEHRTLSVNMDNKLQSLIISLTAALLLLALLRLIDYWQYCWQWFKFLQAYGRYRCSRIYWWSRI